MAFDNSNSGALWVNKKKTDNHPDYTGSAEIDGVDYWISAWRKKAGDNPRAPIFSIKFTAKEAQALTPPTKYHDPVADNITDVSDFDDDIPF